MTIIRHLAHLDDEVALVVADLDVGEQFGGEEVAKRLVEPLVVVGLADAQLHVGDDRLGLEPLVAAHGDRADDGRGLGRDGRGRRRGGLRFLREQRRGKAAQDGADQQRRA